MLVFLALLLVSILFAAPAAAWTGAGTSGDPYKITSEEDLIRLSNDTLDKNYYAGKYFQLTKDIVMTKPFFPIGGTESWEGFQGNFNGNYHTISNLTYPDVSWTIDAAGLFGYVKSSSESSPVTIQNLNVQVSSALIPSFSYPFSYWGGLVGSAKDCNIVNCHVVVDSDIPEVGGMIGGLVGSYGKGNNAGEIKNCSAIVKGSIMVNQTTDPTTTGVGGLVGVLNSESSSITNSYAQVSGDIIGCGVTGVGGLVGYLESPATFTNCYAAVGGNIYAYILYASSYGSAGGLIGQTAYGTVVTNCYTVVAGEIGPAPSTKWYPGYPVRSVSGFLGGERGGITVKNSVALVTTLNESLQIDNTFGDEVVINNINRMVPDIPSQAPGAATITGSYVHAWIQSADGNFTDTVIPNTIPNTVTPSQFWGQKSWWTEKAGFTFSSSAWTMGTAEGYELPILAGSPEPVFDVRAIFAPSRLSILSVTATTPSSYEAVVNLNVDPVILRYQDSFYLNVLYSPTNDISTAQTVPAVLNRDTLNYSATLNGLTPNTTYYIWADLLGGIKEGTPFTTPAASANTPTIAFGSTMANITFTVTVPDGSTYNDLPDTSVLFNTENTAATAYVVAASPYSVSGTTATYQAVVTGLSPDTTYYFWSKIGTDTQSSVASGKTGTFTLSDPSAGTITTTGAKITVTLTDSTDNTPPTILYSTGTDYTLAQSVPAIRNGTTTTYYANLDGLTPGTIYYYWAQYTGQTNTGSPATFTTASSADATVSVTAVRNTPTSATFTITTANGDGAAPILSYWTTADTAKKYTAVAVAADADKWTVTVSDLIANTAYSYSADYSGKTSTTGTLSATESSYTIQITSPAADTATGISTSPLISWQISNVDSALPAVEPVITITGGAGEVIGTTNTGETGTDRTYQTALRGLAFGTKYTIRIDYDGASVSRSFTTETAPAAVTLNVPALMTGSLTETGVSFLIKVDNVTDNLGAVFLLYNTKNDADNATAVAAIPSGSNTGTTRGYYAGLTGLTPGTQYYVWSWIDGTAPMQGTAFTTLSADISIDKRFTTLTVGTAATLTTTGGSGTTDIEWTTNNPGVLEIDWYSGEITAHKAGKAKITVTGIRPDGSTTTASLVITVNDEPAVSTAGWDAVTPIAASRSAGPDELIKIPTLTRGETTGFINTCLIDDTIVLTDNTGTTAPYTRDGNSLKITTPETGKTYTASFTGRKLGDVNNDGKIDVIDALKITRYAAELDSIDNYQLVYADTNGLAGVTAKDALAIMEYTVGIRNPDYRYI